MRRQSWALAVRFISLLIFIVSLIWLLTDFHFEPLVGVLTSLAAILATLSRVDETQPTESIPLQDAHNRKEMLNLVQDFWIKGVLEQSLQGMAVIELGLEERNEAVENRLWGMVVQTHDQPNRVFPQGTKLSDIFVEMGRSLLILGEPGSGKTTSLLQLAKDLINQAETDAQQPIPVVFNLSSWTTKYGTLDAWLVHEMQTRYLVPGKLAKSWINSNSLAILLDGLDEVSERYREDCIRAINEFRQKHGFVSLVVCSRIVDYEQLVERLQLRGAVVLKPLSNAQINDYLDKSGDRLSAVRSALVRDPILQEMVTSPLMLNILVLAYQGKSANDLRKFDSIEAKRSHLFEAYIEQMFRRYGTDSKYKPNYTRRWLSWLADKMKRNNQSLFLIEGLQPSWLSSPPELRSYIIISRLALGILLSLVFLLGNLGITIAFFGGRSMPGNLLLTIAFGLLVLSPILVGMDLAYFRWLLKGKQVERQRLSFGRILGCLCHLLLGVVIFTVSIFIGIVTLVLFEAPLPLAFLFSIILSLLGILIVGRRALWQHLELMVVLVIFLMNVVIVYILLHNLTLATFSGIFWLIIGTLIIRRRRQWRNLEQDIQIMDTLNWSWRGAGRGLLVGAAIVIVPTILFGLFLELFMGWLKYALVEFMFVGHSNTLSVYGFLSILAFALIFGTVWGIFSGIQARIVGRTSQPNRGTWLTLRNGITIGVVVTTVVGGLSGIVFILWYGHFSSSIKFLPTILLACALLIFTPITLYYGLIDFLYHFALRLVLIWYDAMPWNYARFLDYTVRLLFLRKIGGGYIFIHPLVLEHFASVQQYEELMLESHKEKRTQKEPLQAGLKKFCRMRTARSLVFSLIVGGILGFLLTSSFYFGSEPAFEQMEQVAHPAASPTPAMTLVNVVVAARYIPEDHVITENDVWYGVVPNTNIFIQGGHAIFEIEDVIGRQARVPFDRGVPLLHQAIKQVGE